MKRKMYFGFCVFLLICLFSGCTPSTVEVIENRADGPVIALSVTMDREMELMDQISKLEYTEILLGQSYRFQYEWKGSTYEIYPHHTKTVIRKDKNKSAYLTEVEEIDAVYALLGLTPVASVIDKRIDLVNDYVIYEAVVTDMETNQSYAADRGLIHYFKQELTGNNT